MEVLAHAHTTFCLSRAPMEHFSAEHRHGWVFGLRFQFMYDAYPETRIYIFSGGSSFHPIPSDGQFLL
jgi:hypothetical protein